MGENDWYIEVDEETEKVTVPADVLEALDEVELPGSWDVDEETGEIMIGIDGNFNGYPLSESVVRQNLEGWLKIAQYYGVDVSPF